MPIESFSTERIRADWRSDALETHGNRVSAHLYRYAVETLLTLCDEVDRLQGHIVELATIPKEIHAPPQQGEETCGCAP